VLLPAYLSEQGDDDMPFSEAELRSIVRDEVRHALVTRPGQDADAGSLFSKVEDIQGGVDRIEPAVKEIKAAVVVPPPPPSP
jgi:hypothetical protein